MLEILQYYTSGFWIWLGISIGMGLILKYTVTLIVGTIGAIRGVSCIYFDAVDNSNTTNNTINKGDRDAKQ